MEPIARRNITDPHRAAAQETIAQSVENDPSKYLTQYCLDHRSFKGRYIAADLMKETFPLYSASKESRNYYNTCAHNSAAVLAAEQFKRVIADRQHPATNTSQVILLTGIPGAGKTSSILVKNNLPDHIHAVFEGQLSNPQTSFAKIQQILDAGLHPVIIVVHTPPHIALDNTIQRFTEEGRGASINVMAEIQGKLPDGLNGIRNKFGEAVQLEIIDRREWPHTKTIAGWQHLDLLRSEGNHEQIKKRLTYQLERYRKAGIITEECYRQANGDTPRPRPDLALGTGNDLPHRPHGSGRSIPQENSPEPLLTPTSTITPAQPNKSYIGNILPHTASNQSVEEIDRFINENGMKAQNVNSVSGSYSGNVVHKNNVYLILDIGKNMATVHKLSCLDSSPEEKSKITISYKNGRALVWPRMITEKSLGLGGG